MVIFISIVIISFVVGTIINEYRLFQGEFSTGLNLLGIAALFLSPLIIFLNRYSILDNEPFSFNLFNTGIDNFLVIKLGLDPLGLYIVLILFLVGLFFSVFELLSPENDNPRPFSGFLLIAISNSALLLSSKNLFSFFLISFLLNFTVYRSLSLIKSPNLSTKERLLQSGFLYFGDFVLLMSILLLSSLSDKYEFVLNMDLLSDANASLVAWLLQYF